MDILNIAAAKSLKEDRSKWISFMLHSMDTCEIIDRIFYERLSDSERNYIVSSLFEKETDMSEAEEKTANFCRLIALLHDIGKLTYVFQNRISVNIDGLDEMFILIGINICKKCLSEEKTPHNVAGQVILKINGFPAEIYNIIGAHHGMANYVEENIRKENYYGTHTINEKENKDILIKRWNNVWREWIDFSLKYTGFSSVEELPKPNIKIQMLLTGLLIMSDWISSNDEYFPFVDVLREEGFDSIIRLSKKRAEKAWDIIDFPECWHPDAVQSEDISYFFKERFAFDPNDIQMAIMQKAELSVNGYGLYILEAPMGTGKTEAALAAAEIIAGKNGQGGVFFGLPTQATSNGVFSRVHKWLDSMWTDDNYALRLVHGMTDLNDEYRSIFHGTANESEDVQGSFVHEWFEGRKQALLSDFVVATVDQFLLMSLKQRHVMLRHLGIAGKVVIIDECHAYDSYMNVYLDNTLTWMGAYKVPVILLSATLPSDRRHDFVMAYLNGVNNGQRISSDSIPYKSEYPSLTWTDGGNVFHERINCSSKPKNIAVNWIDEDEICDVLTARLSDGGCAAVIVNTVKRAQILAEAISNNTQGYDVLCFHSRFIATDRAEIENCLLRRVGKHSDSKSRNKLIVVATQVIEQSLDLDFDYMITDLCPMDLLLQRIGRLHRHDRKRPDKLCKAEISILNCSDINTSKVYSEWILYRTKKYIPETIIIPDDVPNLVNNVYSEPYEEEKSYPEYKDYERGVNDKRTRAEEYCIKSSLINSRRSTLAMLMENETGNSTNAEAAVRDTDETIETIVLCVGNNGMYHFASNDNSDIILDSTSAISEEMALRVSRERIKLPFYFARYYFDETENTINQMPERWQENPYLKGELLMLLDEFKEVVIAGKKLRYDGKYGLTEFEKGGENE